MNAKNVTLNWTHDSESIDQRTSYIFGNCSRLGLKMYIFLTLE